MTARTARTAKTARTARTAKTARTARTATTAPTAKATGRRLHHTTKSPAQLDDEIAEALRDAENAKMHEEVRALSPRLQELVLRTQELAALGDELKRGGLRLDHGRDGVLRARGKTYEVKDVLKKHGFKFDGGSKEWTRRYAPTARYGDIDYLSLYADLIKKL